MMFRDHDNLVAQETGVMLPRFPPEAIFTFDDSMTSLTIGWNGSITAFGGEFRLCWCAGAWTNQTDCRLTRNFVVDFGRFNLLGPLAYNLQRTCVAGQTCQIDGVGVDSTDSLMVLETCGTTSLRVSLEPISIGTFGTVNSSILPSPVGNYRLCWCAGNETSDSSCELTEEFQTDLGEFWILGPKVEQDRTCVTGRECTLDGLEGSGLNAADRWFVLDTCGLPTISAISIPRMANAGQVLSVTRSGSSVTFGSALVTAEGGVYRLCWCAAGFSCSSSEHYRVDAGELLLVGPSSGSRTCISGQTCSFPTPLGKMLQSTDSYLILDTCGVAGSSVTGLPDGGMLSISNGTSGRCRGGDCELTFGTTIVTAVGGRYQLCWCGSSTSPNAYGTPCIREDHFVVTVGSFELIGPEALSTGRTCIAGQRCVVDDVNLWAYNETMFDTLVILDTCGLAQQMAYVAASNITDGSARFNFDLITAAGGPGLRS